MTRKTFDKNLEMIEVKEEEDADDSDLTREATEAILEESEVKEEEIHITDILPEMDVVVNDQLVHQMFPYVPKSKRKGPRCRQCPGCTRPDCGQCKNCKDKVKFGGDGHLKQACALKVCDNQAQSKEKLLAEISVENVTMETSNSNDKENDPQEIIPLGTDPSQPPMHVRNLIFSPPKGNDNPNPTPKKCKESPSPEQCQ